MATVNDAPTAPAVDNDGLPKEGDIIAGKYRVDRVIGRGGMGVVVVAEHIMLRQRVAVKFILPEAVARDGAAKRFLREAQSAAAIQSEHVAKVLDSSTLESGVPYIVMEFLTGQDLGHVLKARGSMPIEEAVDYVLQACEAIAEAHARGIIHRDLKPANLFLTARADGSSLVKVLDFGLSKATRPDAPGALETSLTATNTLLGSPHYMSPEQVRNLKTIDSRTDIWAIGVILYQLLTSYRPFDEESLGGLFIRIGTEPATPIQTYRTDIPEGLVAVVMRCLEKEMRARYQTVAELARGLEPFGTASSRLSVERILRVLSDHAPLPPPRGTLPSFNDIRNSPSNPPSAVKSSSGSVRITSGGVESSTAMASTLAQDESGSEDRPLTQRNAAAARRSMVPLVIGGSIGVILLGTVIVLLVQPNASVADSQPSLAASTAVVSAAPTALAANPPPTVAPEALAVPALSAAPSASLASSVAAPASAAASASAKTAPIKGGKAPSVAPSTKKNPGDPMDRMR